MATYTVTSDYTNPMGGNGTTTFFSAQQFSNKALSGGDTVVLIGTFREYFYNNTGSNRVIPWVNNMTINKAARTISIPALSPDFPTRSFTAAEYIFLDTPLNKGYYKIAAGGVAATVLTLDANTPPRADETPSWGRVCSPLAASGTPNMLPIVTSAVSLTWDLTQAVFDAGIDINDGMYQWNLSASGTNEYYLTTPDGKDPLFYTAGLINVGSDIGTMTVDGLRYDVSNASTLFPQCTLGTAGSIANDMQWALGSSDTGFTTIYIRCNSGLSYLNARDIRIAGHLGILDPGTRASQTYNGDASTRLRMSAKWLFNTGTPSSGTHVFNGAVLEYAGLIGVNNSGTGTLTCKNVITYCTGHRGFGVAGAGTTELFHCVDFMAHLGMIKESTGTIRAKNSIFYFEESGALDNKNAGGTVDETYNHFAPYLDDGNNKLAYINAANWATTAATSNPPSFATSTVAAGSAGIINSTFANPRFVRISYYGYDLCDFHLGAGSPCIATGVPQVGTVDTDLAGASYSTTVPNKGAFATIGANGSGNLGGGGSGGSVLTEVLGNILG